MSILRKRSVESILEEARKKRKEAFPSGVL